MDADHLEVDYPETVYPLTPWTVFSQEYPSPGSEIVYMIFGRPEGVGWAPGYKRRERGGRDRPAQ